MDIEKVLASFGLDPKDYGFEPADHKTPVGIEIPPDRTINCTPDRNLRPKSAPGPAPGVLNFNFTSGSAQEETPVDLCLCCHSYKWFKRKDGLGPWVCAICHPPRVPPSELLWDVIQKH